jgi:hypothetical protein
MNTIKFTLAALLAISVLYSCSKQGPTGPQGEQGVAGPAGPQGNANVSGQTFYITPSQWTFLNGQYSVLLTDNALTSGIDSAGSVDVYLSTDGANSWTPIPSIYIDTLNNPSTAYWNDIYAIGSVTVTWTWSNGRAVNNPNVTYGVNCFFKVVCIAPAIMKKHPNTNWRNPAEVAKLPEVKEVLSN